jgi:hypothetical protein
MDKSIISDWNGTLYKETDEKKLYAKIGIAYLKSLIKETRHSPKTVLKIIGLVKTKFQLEGIYKKVKTDGTKIKELYEIYNKKVIDGLDPYFIFSLIDGLSAKAVEDVDRRLIRLIWSEKIKGIKTGILSGAWERSIIAVLSEIKRKYGMKPFDYEDVVGDKLSYNADGTAHGFELRVHGRKGYYIEDEFARKRGFRNIIYFGDTEDDIDCFDYVTSNGGKVVLPFFLIERQKKDKKVTEFISYCSSKYNAFIPKDERDLMKFLKG